MKGETSPRKTHLQGEYLESPGMTALHTLRAVDEDLIR
jgi:hypothetical protein